MTWACSIQTEPRASASVVAQAFYPVFRVSPTIASLLKEEKHRHECPCYSGRASAHVLVAANAALWGRIASCWPVSNPMPLVFPGTDHLHTSRHDSPNEKQSAFRPRQSGCRSCGTKNERHWVSNRPLHAEQPAEGAPMKERSLQSRSTMAHTVSTAHESDQDRRRQKFEVELQRSGRVVCRDGDGWAFESRDVDFPHRYWPNSLLSIPAFSTAARVPGPEVKITLCVR
jgi:hypothetical protein